MSVYVNVFGLERFLPGVFIALLGDDFTSAVVVDTTYLVPVAEVKVVVDGTDNGELCVPSELVEVESLTANKNQTFIPFTL